MTNRAGAGAAPGGWSYGLMMRMVEHRFNATDGGTEYVG